MTSKISPVLRFWQLMRQYRQPIRLIYYYAIFNGLVNLSLPLGIQAIINYIQTGELTISWVILVCFVLIGIAVTGIVQVLQLRVVEDVQQDIFARSAMEFSFRLPRIQHIELDTIHAPELVNRFFDTLTIQKGLPKILIDFSLSSFQIIFGLALLTIYSPYFIILGASLVLILFVIFKLTAPRGLATSLKESKYKYKLVHWLEEVARVNRTFKLHRGDKLHLRRTDDIAIEYLNAREKHFKILLEQFKYFIGFKVIVAASLLVLGGLLVFQEQMNIGQFVAAEIIIILIINSVEKILKVIETIYDVLTALDKIGYVTDLELDEEEGIATDDFEDGIHIKALDLEFGYPNERDNTINGLSFDLPAYSKVVLKGDTGSGKSTLLHLLSGIYKLQSGAILMDGVPIENYSKEFLYENIGLGLPTNQIFEGSIKNNITVGRQFSDLRMSEVLEVIGLTDYLAHLPKGLDTWVDSGGRRLPRSIIQKLLLARIIIGKPKLLLLEDPLHYVDDGEKRRLIDYIMAPDQPWTAIVIADYYYWDEKSDYTIKL